MTALRRAWDTVTSTPLRDLKRGRWRSNAVPAACATVPTMLLPDELRLLDFLAGDYWRGEGVIVDGGSFLGGSTVALANGVRRNLRRRGVPEEAVIQSYDLFTVEDWTRGIYFPEETPAGASTRAAFDANIAPFAPLITVHEGDITAALADPRPVEILFIDVAKHWRVGDHLIEHIFPRLIPGRAMVVQQDYLYHYWNGWLHVAMEYFADEFEQVCDTGRNSVAFRLRKPFAPGRIVPKLVERLPTPEKIRLADRAAARFPEDQAALLRAAKVHFLELLSEEGLA